MLRLQSPSFHFSLKNNSQRIAFFVIIGLLIAAGVTYVLLTKASSPSVAYEAEDSAKAGDVVVKFDTSASGGTYISLGSTPTPTIKPKMSGVIDRDPYNFTRAISKSNIDIPASYEGVVNNFVMMIDWSKIQPNNATQFDTSYIDDAIAEAKARNMHIKLRVTAGIHAPSWVKALNGGPFDVYDVDGTTGEVFTGTSPKFWTAEVKTAYSDLMQKLAAKYDNEPTILSVVDSLCTTIFAEPFIRNYDEGNNFATYTNAGLTKALDEQCQNDSIDIHNKWWKQTRTETAVNPLAYIGTNSTGATVQKFDVDFAVAWVARCRQILGERCILGNNGFNIGNTSLTYRQVIGAEICAGNPAPYFQTRQWSVIQSTGHTLEDVIKYAADVGANMVELPAQYKTTASTPDKLAPLDARLEANSVIPCPADKLLPLYSG